MTVGEEKRQKTKYHTLLWIILAVIIIIIFIILSTIIIGGRILDMAQREGNVIELDTNESYESSSKSSTGKSNLQDDEQIDIGDDKSKGLEVSDDNAKWETSTTVDIFKEAYENESGDISVKSEDGDKVIAPGTSNEYEFKLKNTGKNELEYKMTFEGMFTLEHEDIPIKVRLKKGDFWILGGNEEWVEPSELDEVVENGSLGINKIAQYELDWMWAFEDDTSDSIIRDTADTNLGNISVDSKIDFKLTINVETEAIPNPAGNYLGNWNYIIPHHNILEKTYICYRFYNRWKCYEDGQKRIPDEKHTICFRESTFWKTYMEALYG